VVLQERPQQRLGGKPARGDSAKTVLKAGLPDFFDTIHIPKREKYTKINTKCTEWSYNMRIDSKINQMGIKFTNTFHCKTLQNLPKLGFLV
jgi:hypothetical protein